MLCCAQYCDVACGDCRRQLFHSLESTVSQIIDVWEPLEAVTVRASPSWPKIGGHGARVQKRSPRVPAWLWQAIGKALSVESKSDSDKPFLLSVRGLSFVSPRVPADPLLAAFDSMLPSIVEVRQQYWYRVCAVQDDEKGAARKGGAFG